MTKTTTKKENLFLFRELKNQQQKTNKEIYKRYQTANTRIKETFP